MKTDLTDMPRFDLQEASNIRFSETTSTTPNFFHLVMFARECESGSQARAAGRAELDTFDYRLIYAPVAMSDDVGAVR